jgi:anaerobic selenocysteine-containing dehydrogenase
MILIGGSSMHKSANGWQAGRAITCLPALTGALGQPGSAWVPVTRPQAPAWAWAIWTAAIAGRRRLRDVRT